MLTQWSLLLHQIGFVVFLPFIVLPFVVKGQVKAGKMGFWKGLFDLAHLYLIISLITGVVLTSNFASSWFWIVIILFLMMGAFMGLTAKYFRLAVEKQEGSDKLVRFSSILAGVTLFMTLVMFVRW